MNRIFKLLFFSMIVKPVVFVVLGLNIRGRNNLPSKGPAVIVANHNSHLDTMVLMSLYPLSQVHKIRPVAAADYFLEQGRLKAWFSKNCIGIIPMDRSGKTEKEVLFSGCEAAFERNEILVLFPEGSRGEPEKMSQLKKGVYHLLKNHTEVPVVPVMLHGLGRALPKGESLLVPFNCDVIIGERVSFTSSADEFVAKIAESFNYLAKFCLTRNQEGEAKDSRLL